MKLRKRIQIIATLLLITLIALMGFNRSVYTHTHKMGNGRMQSHAHPYNKTDDSAPIKNHQHSMVEFVLLDHISILFLSVFLVLGLIFRQRLVEFISAPLVWRNPLLVLSYQGRAPPASC